MQGWDNFYGLAGQTAATLLGLLFVSVSINAEMILGESHRHSRRLAEQAFQNYLCVVAVSILDFFPHIDRFAYAQSVLWVSAVWGAWAVARTAQAFLRPPPDQPMMLRLRRYVPSVAGYGLLFYACIVTLQHGTDEAVYAATAILLLMLSATIVSWDLLIQMAARRFGPREGGGEG